MIVSRARCAAESAGKDEEGARLARERSKGESRSTVRPLSLAPSSTLAGVGGGTPLPPLAPAPQTAAPPMESCLHSHGCAMRGLRAGARAAPPSSFLGDFSFKGAQARSTCLLELALLCGVRALTPGSCGPTNVFVQNQAGRETMRSRTSPAMRVQMPKAGEEHRLIWADWG